MYVSMYDIAVLNLKIHIHIYMCSRKVEVSRLQVDPDLHDTDWCWSPSYSPDPKCQSRIFSVCLEVQRLGLKVEVSVRPNKQGCCALQGP